MGGLKLSWGETISEDGWVKTKLGRTWVSLCTVNRGMETLFIESPEIRDDLMAQREMIVLDIYLFD